MATGDDLINVLKLEIQPAMGCTEVGAAALAAAKAVETLGETPETLSVVVSPNIYKNGVFVGIPGTEFTGLVSASALGGLIRNSDAGLNVLDSVSPEKAAEAEAWIRKGGVSVTYDDGASDRGIFACRSFGGGAQGRRDDYRPPFAYC